MSEFLGGMLCGFLIGALVVWGLADKVITELERRTKK